MNGNTHGPPVEVLVWGSLACFTRPEMKVERVSYPVMTPSAARGVLEAIFWRPEFAWVVREISVLRPVRYFSILRNEVNTRVSERTARGWQQAGGAGGFVASEDRTQRHSLALRDVAYVVRAEVALRPDVTDDAAKYRDQFRRRVRTGRCAWQPYLGCREFAADFAEPDGSERPLEDFSESLGRMLLDIEYAPDGSGRGTPRFFDAVVERGVLKIPPRELGWEAA
jgi:CRISPR-associated protein Cas5d